MTILRSSAASRPWRPGWPWRSAPSPSLWSRTRTRAAPGTGGSHRTSSRTCTWTPSTPRAACTSCTCSPASLAARAAPSPLPPSFPPRAPPARRATARQRSAETRTSGRKRRQRRMRLRFGWERASVVPWAASHGSIWNTSSASLGFQRSRSCWRIVVEPGTDVLPPSRFRFRFLQPQEKEKLFNFLGKISDPCQLFPWTKQILAYSNRRETNQSNNNLYGWFDFVNALRKRIKKANSKSECSLTILGGELENLEGWINILREREETQTNQERREKGNQAVPWDWDSWSSKERKFQRASFSLLSPFFFFFRFSFSF